jgi:putative salt-induced outer membrane protein
MMLSSVVRVSATLLVAAAPLLAQDAAAPKKPPYEFVADFGLAASQGNQEITTINLGQRYSYAFEKWKFSQDFNAVRGSNNGTTNAELFQVGLRGDYALGPKVSLFVRTTGLRNRFAGLNSFLNEAVGLGIKAVSTDIDKLEFAFGVGALQRSFVSGVSPSSQNDLVGSADGLYRHNFSKVAYFEQTANFIPNFSTGDAWQLAAKSALVAPLSAKLGLKVGYLVNFNNAPPTIPAAGSTPARTFKKFDGLFTAGVQFTY